MSIHLDLSDEVAAVVLFLVSLACAALLFWIPRAVAPVELPSLQLSAAEVDAALKADAQAARTTLASPRVATLERLMLEQGRSEQAGSEEVGPYDARRAALVREYAALAAEVGAQRALALRARAAERLEAALDMKLPTADARAVIGAMNSMLARDAVSVDGYLVAPRFLVRTLYKARWNLLHGLAVDHQFARVEKQAFHGWEALNVERLPLARRVEGLRAYEQASGQHVAEAWGVLSFRAGELQQAAQMLELAYREHPSLRLRNYVNGARTAASAEAGAMP